MRPFQYWFSCEMFFDVIRIKHCNHNRSLNPNYIILPILVEFNLLNVIGMNLKLLQLLDISFTHSILLFTGRDCRHKPGQISQGPARSRGDRGQGWPGRECCVQTACQTTKLDICHSVRCKIRFFWLVTPHNPSTVIFWDFILIRAIR